MNSCRVQFVGIVLGLICVAAAVRQPKVVYNVNPTPGPGYLAACPPTVVSTGGAFMCYHVQGGSDVVVWVSPAGNLVGPPTSVPNNFFVFPPIALSSTTGLAFSSGPTSFAVEFSSTQGGVSVINRNGSLANVAYAPDLQLAYVPFGPGTSVGPFYDSIVAYSTAAGTMDKQWAVQLTVPPPSGRTSALSSPVYYRGFLLVTAGTALYKFNASTGDLVATHPNPCNVTLALGSVVSMYQFTYGKDQNGDLDGFLIVSNTSTATVAQTTFCRVSHNSVTMKWIYQVPSNVRVLDVTGLAFTAMVTAHDMLAPMGQEIATFGFDADYGTFLGKLSRDLSRDQFNFPRVLPVPTNGCYETFVLTIGGNLTAFCSENFNVAVWRTATPCNYRAEVDAATNSILCVARGSAVNRLDFGGNLLWSFPADAEFAAMVVEDLVWFVDGQSTLWGLSVALPFVQPPMTDILYQVHPDPANLVDIVATCPPTVASTGGAFMCYKNLASGLSSVQFVDPSNILPRGPAVTVMQERFVMPPIAVSNYSAIAYSSYSTNSFYVFFGSQDITYSVFNRSGARGDVAYSPDLALAYVPIGMKLPMQPFFELEAYDLSTFNNFSSKWYRSYPQEVESPIFYRNLVVFVTGTKFIVANASSGLIIVTTSNPCGFMLAPGATIQLFQINFGYDEFGPLDAFIMTANTSGTDAATSVCRVSHNDGSMKWSYTLNNDVSVMDVVGATNTVLITGRFNDIKNDFSFITFGLNAVSGSYTGSINRNLPQDYLNFPLVLPQAVSGCIETMVLQVNGQLQAYCTNVVQGTFYQNPVWTAPYACNYRAVAYTPTSSLVCVESGVSVTLLDFFGNAIWSEPRVSVEFIGSIVSDIVWVVDLDCTLWGLSMTPSGVSPGQGGAPEETDGLTGGEVVLIVFLVVFLAALTGAVGYTWLKRSKRRSAYVKEADVEGSYGSLTGN